MGAWAEGGWIGTELKGHEVTLRIMEMFSILVVEKNHEGAFLSNSLGVVFIGVSVISKLTQ